MNIQGNLAIILHAHTPFARYHKKNQSIEERWFFEALTESYLPLLDRFWQLTDEGIPFRLTISFTPTLLAMLSDERIQERYIKYIEQRIELAEKELQRTKNLPKFYRLALFYHHRLTAARYLYMDVYRRNLIRSFCELRDRGVIDAIASCATHAYLPLLHAQSTAVKAQIDVGLQAFEQSFGFKPEGFWFPECGYHPGFDTYLKERGIRYFIVDAHGILFASPRPKYGIYSPVQCASTVAAFARDPVSTQSVWNTQGGYLSDSDYREFHRDIGFDLDYEYLRPYLSSDGSRIQTGIKYFRITGKTEQKQPYDPDQALEKASSHASDFLTHNNKQIVQLTELMDREPIIVIPFAMELLGHWWFEGADWLELLIRKTHSEKPYYRFVSPSDYLNRYESNQVTQPALSSWGERGYHDVWLNGTNDWVYRHLNTMARRMCELTGEYPETEGLRYRVLNQMARELLLAQSSDWPFILKFRTRTSYAYRRINEYVGRFQRLYDSFLQNRIDAEWLGKIEREDSLFPFIDYRVYAPKPAPRQPAAV